MGKSIEQREIDHQETRPFDEGDEPKIPLRRKKNKVMIKRENDDEAHQGRRPDFEKVQPIWPDREMKGFAIIKIRRQTHSKNKRDPNPDHRTIDFKILRKIKNSQNAGENANKS